MAEKEDHRMNKAQNLECKIMVAIELLDQCFVIQMQWNQMNNTVVE
jgi:hypothetical protein